MRQKSEGDREKETIFHEPGEDADLQDISIDSTYIKAHKASAVAEREGALIIR